MKEFEDLELWDNLIYCYRYNRSKMDKAVIFLSSHYSSFINNDVHWYLICKIVCWRRKQVLLNLYGNVSQKDQMIPGYGMLLWLAYFVFL